MKKLFGDLQQPHVTLIGFGTFKVSKTAARKGRNPQTGKPLQIKAGKRVRFTAGKALKDSVKSSNQRLFDSKNS